MRRTGTLAARLEIFLVKEQMMRKLAFLTLFAVIAALAVPAGASNLYSNKDDAERNPSIYHPTETIHYLVTLRNESATDTVVITKLEDWYPDASGYVDIGPATPFNILPTQTRTVDVYWNVPAGQSAGPVTNLVHVVGYQITNTGNDPINDLKGKTSLIVKPCVDVLKSVTPTVTLPGRNVTYTITVCNCGEPNIVPVSVIDTVLGDITSYFTKELAQGQCESHDFIYEARDIDPCNPDCELPNEVTADYNDVYGWPVSDTDDACVNLLHPDFTIAKDCTEVGPVEPNSTVIFRITVTNTGDVKLYFWDDANEIPPFSLDPSGVYQQDVARLAGSDDVFNSVTMWATLDPALGLTDVIVGPKEANDVCPVETQGATRTLGFWKTHCDYTAHVFTEHCGGPFNLGWKTATTVEDVLGFLFANPAKNADGSKRDDQLCQARVNASRQAVAALLNNCLDNGAPLPVSPAEIATILGGTDKTAINQLGGILDDYNNSGDEIAIVDGDGYTFGNATPKFCAGIANIAAADCPIVVSPTLPKIKPRGR
jgi:uncharacterized repeat protein (TIGR01451 family)